MALPRAAHHPSTSALIRGSRLKPPSLPPLRTAGLCTLGALARQYGEPAAVLALTALLWARLHPSSHQIGRCIAALVPVMAGYSSTARECAAAARREDGEMDIEQVVGWKLT